MEKLKCTSCGGEINVDEDKEYGTCPYCGTKYKLKKDVNLNIKLDDNMKEVINNGFGTVGRFSKFMFIPIIVFIAIVFISISVSFISFHIDEDKDSFNFQFSHVSGTKDAFFIDSTLDKIVESNNTHDRKVALVFDGVETTDKSEIISIKHSLSGTYEVSLEYEKGYVSKVVLEKVNKGNDSDDIQNRVKELQEKAMTMFDD